MKNISVRGTIVSNDDKWIYDWLDIEAVSPKDIEKGLSEAAGDEVTLEVNSGGGDVFAGNDIYYLLSTYKGKITADITGLAASAATIVCCGAGKVRANPGAQYMIHNVSTYGVAGDYHKMDHTSQILQTANKSISNIYRLKTGMSNDELLKIMDAETWMDAEKAVSYGFVDEIIGDNGDAQPRKPFTLYNASAAVILSEEAKQKVRQQLKNPNENKPIEDIHRLKNQLQIIKLRGGKR